MQITSVIDTLPVLQISSVAENSCTCPAQDCSPCATIAVTGIICAAVIIVAIVAIVMYYRSKAKEWESQLEASMTKWEHENAERKARQDAEKETAEMKRNQEVETAKVKREQELENAKIKREQEKENRDRERREQLIAKYLCFMEELTKKESISENDTDYKEELKRFINEIPNSK